ncbi:hypothetical protein JIR001_13010 [Polycladomyces abyssicola]|uniref:Uncharacterized protein n=1 Tax=Polycladomyces abyssicola TaxID=1125966 RepID=A0A8D5UG00_9BACL|nr:hypothetical protein [Polycladomyces abyssicola]BCU81518.1 hypothetical protein JIR001_13010 [Polycladomyces abyssicola]
MVRQPNNGWRLILFVLMGIGILRLLIVNPVQVLVPLLIAGVVFYLYKFPPQWFLRWNIPSHSRSIRPRKKGRPTGNRFRGRRPTFRVIEGSKKQEQKTKTP